MTTPGTQRDDYYDVLGISRGADAETIRDAIRGARRRWRQLTGSADLAQRQRAEQRMTMLEEAEQTLLDETARQRYDAELAAAYADPSVAADTGEGANGPMMGAPIDTAAGTDWGVRADEYYRSGDVRNAMAAAKKGTDVDPDDTAAWFVYVRAATDLERYEEADFASAELVSRLPNDARSHSTRGEVLDRCGRSPEAEEAFRRAASLDADDVFPQVRAAWSVLDQGRVQEAVAEAWGIAERFPQETFPRHVLRAACEQLRQQGRPLDALTVAQRLLTEDATDDDTMVEVVRAIEGVADTGALDSALEQSWNLLQSHPENGRAQQVMRYVIVELRRRGRGADAVEHSRALLARYPQDDSVREQFAWSRINDAEQRMAQPGGGRHLILNKAQADFYGAAASEVAAMGIADDGVRGAVANMQAYHRTQMATKVRLNVGTVLLAILAVLSFLSGIGAFGASNIVLIVIGLLLGWWFWAVSVHKQYRLSYKDASPATRESGIR